MERLIFVDHWQSSLLNSGSEDIRLYNRDLFAIHTPFAIQNCDQTSAKRKRSGCGDAEMNCNREWPVDEDLAEALRTFVKRNSDKFSETAQGDADNSKAKLAAAVVPSTYFFQGCSQQAFHNEGNGTERRTFQNRQFLLPPHSLGVLSTLSRNSAFDLLNAASTLYGTEGRFDLIVMDPPWINKSVKRQRRYMTADAEDCLAQLTLEDLLADDGLLIVWYTHNASNYAQLKAQLDKWKLKLVATWTWLKVTTSGLPVCPFGRNFKKPYEHVLLAARGQALIERLAKSDGTIVISVPSAVHSHKPNLEYILELFGICCKRLRCLELFARTLKTNWVSFGNEVIKLQCVEMFDDKSTPVQH